MAVDEHTRRVLYERLEDAIGLEAATALMEHLPPVGWADVATKRDLDAHALLMKRDLDAHAVVMKRDLDAHAVVMKRDLDAQALLMKRDLDVLAAKMDAMGDRLRAEFRGQSWSLFFSVLAANATVVGMAVAVERWL